MTDGPQHRTLLTGADVERTPVPNPDGLVSVAGSIFVKTDDGAVVRIDPTSRRVTGRVKLDTTHDVSHYCQGIGTDGTYVWACATGPRTTGVVQLDPLTLRKVGGVAVDKVFDQLTLPHNRQGIWVLVNSGRAIAVVDPRTRTSVTYALPYRCQQVAVSDIRVVTSCSADGRVLVLDPMTGHVLADAHLQSPRLATVVGQDVWVDTSDGLTRLGPDLSVRTIYSRVTAGLDGDVVTSEGAVWVRGRGGLIWKIDPQRNVVVDLFQPPSPISAGSLLVTQDSFWTSASNDGYVARIRR